MKKRLVTYGVSGMMEYQAIIKIGRSAMKVLFTDGSMNAMGENPATYTTDNFMVQHAIENSDHFKRGRIHIVRTVLLDSDVHIDRNNKRKEAPIEETPAPTPAFIPAPEEGVEGDESAESDNTESQAEEPIVEEPIVEEAPAPIPMEMTKEITEMEFDNNDDARDFLETKFGYVRSKLRNRADIVAAGEAHNIAISFS